MPYSLNQNQNHELVIYYTFTVTFKGNNLSPNTACPRTDVDSSFMYSVKLSSELLRDGIEDISRSRGPNEMSWDKYKRCIEKYIHACIFVCNLVAGMRLYYNDAIIFQWWTRLHVTQISTFKYIIIIWTETDTFDYHRHKFWLIFTAFNFNKVGFFRSLYSHLDGSEWTRVAKKGKRKKSRWIYVMLRSWQQLIQCTADTAQQGRTECCCYRFSLSLSNTCMFFVERRLLVHAYLNILLHDLFCFENHDNVNVYILQPREMMYTCIFCMILMKKIWLKKHKQVNTQQIFFTRHFGDKGEWERWRILRKYNMIN